MAETHSCTIRAIGLVSAFSVQKSKFQEVLAEFPHEKTRLEAKLKLKKNPWSKVRAFCKFLPAGSKETPTPEQDTESEAADSPLPESPRGLVRKSMDTRASVCIGDGYRRGSEE